MIIPNHTINTSLTTEARRTRRDYAIYTHRVACAELRPQSLLPSVNSIKPKVSSATDKILKFNKLSVLRASVVKKVISTTAENYIN